MTLILLAIGDIILMNLLKNKLNYFFIDKKVSHFYIFYHHENKLVMNYLIQLAKGKM